MGGKSAQPSGTIDNTGTQKSRTNTSAATQTDIPDFLRPFIQGNVRNATNARNSFNQLTRDDLVADFTPDQMAAFEAARGFGTGAPFQSALNAFQSTAQGDYLYGGPAQQAFIDAAVNSAQPGVISRFGGRGGSGLAAASIGQSAVDAYAGLYNNERQRQMQAASGLPTLAMTPIDLLLQTGGQQQTQAQNEINAPLAAAQDRYSMAMGGLPITSLLGTSQTGTSRTRGNTLQQQPYYENETAGVLGGALSGASLGSTFGPIGTGVGAVAGGLLGLF